MGIYLNFLWQKSPEKLYNGVGIVGNVLTYPTAKIGKYCRTGPNVTVGSSVNHSDGYYVTPTTILLWCCC